MRSIFFRRLLLVLVAAILFSFMLISAGYFWLSRDVYTQIQNRGGTPDAEALGQLLAEHAAGNLTGEGLRRIAEQHLFPSTAAICYTGAGGELLFLVENAPSLSDTALREELRASAPQVLSGEALQARAVDLGGPEEYFLSGQRVLGEGGALVGGVFLVETAYPAAQVIGSLNTLLAFCVIVLIFVVLALSSLGMRRVTNPLQEISEVAIRMSKGEFSARADDSGPGEIGVLARALNNLGDSLSSSIIHLSREKSQLNELLASLTDGVAALDELGALMHYNPALMKIFGAVKVESREELIPDPAVWAAFDEVYATGRARTLNYHMPNDRVLWITIAPVTDQEGVCTGVVGLFKDMTELERLEQMRREYIANISHELRTPLTALRGLLEPLADGMVQQEEDRQRYYRIMLHEVERLSRLITDMMTLTRLQSGSEYMELTRVDVKELIEDLAQGYASAAAKKGIALATKIEGRPLAYTDPDKVEQVLVILLDNAIRYTPVGGSVTLRVSDGERLTVSVTDTGCGIPEKDLAEVFERFYKVDKSRKEGGTGLGLSIAKQILDKLGETIRVDSVEGRGASFSFTLKKYVRNIIALGPAQEEWQPQKPDAGARDMPLTSKNLPQDAQYEILNRKGRRGREDKK